MVPDASKVITDPRLHPVIRFNGHPAADLLGEVRRVLSSGEAMAKVTELAQKVLPPGMAIIEDRP